MNTLALVVEKYGSDIALADICDEHFSQSLRVAERKARRHELPLPFYKKTGKSGFFCSAKAWADYLDNKAMKAEQEWEKANGA